MTGPTPCPRWNPYQTFVWTKRELQAWYDTVGAFGSYDGRAWEPKVKSLGVGRYEVRFIEHQF